MKAPSQQTRQPQHTDVLALQQLIQSGLVVQAETQIHALLMTYPKAIVLYNLLGICQQGQGKYREALASFRKIVPLNATIAEIHYNIASLLVQLGETKQAIASYQRTLQLKPNFASAHFNVGALLQAQGLLQQATTHYRQAIALEPGFFEALVNLGTVLQQGGQLAEAEQCYRKALELRPEARGYFNLATTLHDQGQHEEACVMFREALQLDPNFADAWNDLGETLRDRGEMDEAIHCYKQALAAQSDHARAKYNLGEFYCLTGRLLEAIPYFEATNFADAQERALQCYYKAQQFDSFKQKFDQLTANKPHTSVLLNTLAMHYAINFSLENTYQFCQQPMNYVVHTQIDELTSPDSPFLKQLLQDIQHLAIAERKQGRLYYGMQSAGNLLMRAEPSFQQLAALIRRKVLAYPKRFSASRDQIIVRFPRQIAFASSWYLQMKQGGYLTSHIHEEGWISGCLYLKLPDKQDSHQGSFEYSTDGDDYPKLHDNFPSQIIDQQVGDLVLFPSCLFHRTIPFSSNQERICVAFDVKPMLSK